MEDIRNDHTSENVGIVGEPIESRATIRKGIKRWSVQMIVSLVIFGALLFLIAGRWLWIAGWVYLGMNAVTQLLSAFVLIPRQGGMLAERSQIHEGTKDWDQVLAPAITIGGTLAVLVTAALDVRFGWSQSLPTGWQALGVAMAFASQMFVLWAMASNSFFSTTVRIQTDRGHAVTQTGPYRYVRHPGYAGALIYTLLVPIVLGSFWTFIPALITIFLIVIRTQLEDQTLQAELPGYKEYAARVKYRLVPDIW
jgi:protein-S-isoprenylcysteine O-methyltransferase Ste14